MENDSTVEDLCQFFSTVSYDYYNLHMAVMISYYNHKFVPLTQKEIYNDISSKEDFTTKLRKSNGKKYSCIRMRIKDILKKKKSVFINQSKKRVRGAKYAINLSLVIPFWKYQVSIMEKERKFKDKKFEEEEDDDNNSSEISSKSENEKKMDEPDKKENDINDLLNEKVERKRSTKLLARKRLNKSKDLSSKNSGNTIELSDSQHPNKMKKQRRRGRKRRKMTTIKKIEKNGYLTDEIKNNKNSPSEIDDISDINDDEELKEIFENAMYDKLPKFDENSLNETIEKYGNLIQKLNDIRENLLKIKNLKLTTDTLDEDKKKAEKEKTSIINYHKILKNKIKNKANTDDITKQKSLLKNSIDSYLEIYGDSYEKLFKILCERNELFDHLIIDREKEITQNINDCFLCLKIFINENKKQITEANNVLINNTRSNSKKKFENILKKFEVKNAVQPLEKQKIFEVKERNIDKGKDNAKKENKDKNEPQRENIYKIGRRGRKPKNYYSSDRAPLKSDKEKEKEIEKNKDKEKEKEKEKEITKEKSKDKDKVKEKSIGKNKEKSKSKNKWKTAEKKEDDKQTKNAEKEPKAPFDTENAPLINRDSNQPINYNNNDKINKDDIINNSNIDNNSKAKKNIINNEIGKYLRSKNNIKNNNFDDSLNLTDSQSYAQEKLQKQKNLSSNFDDNSISFTEKNNKAKISETNNETNNITSNEYEYDEASNLSKKSRTTATFYDGNGDGGYKYY